MTLDPAASVTWRLPEWIAREIDLAAPHRGAESAMELAIELARRNVDHGGGPFGATIVDSASGAVVAVGANWVVSQRSSLLHAEIAAIAFAQAALGSHTLAGGSYDLVTSSEPCAQCLGATVWSGVRHLVCGAPASDAEAIGFDEGPIRDDWVEELERRGIRVTRGVLAAKARGVLAAYKARGGFIYNGLGPR
jgi:tRNA(Arg) A34 adenosine deaminase TadA